MPCHGDQVQAGTGSTLKNSASIVAQHLTQT